MYYYFIIFDFMWPKEKLDISSMIIENLIYNSG